MDVARFCLSMICLKCGATVLRTPITMLAVMREGASVSTTAKPVACCGDGRLTIRLDRTDKPFVIVETR